MRKKRDVEGPRVQCLASGGDLTPDAVARLLRTLAGCSAELVAVRVVTHERATLRAALDAISTGVDVDVQVRGGTTSPMASDLWKLLEGDVAQLQALSAIGPGSTCS